MKGLFIRRKKARKSEGFTLIEVLITIFLLAIVLISLISAFIYGFNILSRIKQVAVAAQIAQEEMEKVRNMDFDSILLLGSTFAHEDLSQLLEGQGSRTLEAGPGDDIKKLTVSVIWKHRGEVQRKDVVTYVTREGINKK